MPVPLAQLIYGSNSTFKLNNRFIGRLVQMPLKKDLDSHCLTLYFRVDVGQNALKSICKGIIYRAFANGIAVISRKCSEGFIVVPAFRRGDGSVLELGNRNVGLFSLIRYWSFFV